METSAKTAFNVDTAFTKTAELILDQIEQGKIDPSNEVIIYYAILDVNGFVIGYWY